LDTFATVSIYTQNAMTSGAMAAAMVTRVDERADVGKAVALKSDLAIPAAPQTRNHVVPEAVTADFPRNEDTWACEL
jgi:hypothetical protein